MHELKLLEQFYDAVKSGEKTFEVRKDDREPRFAVNDLLILREITAEGEYTGRGMLAGVDFVLRGRYCKPGYCIMSIKVISELGCERANRRYNRIRSKSLGELAEYLCDHWNCRSCPAWDQDYCHSADLYICSKAMKNWLESEAIL